MDPKELFEVATKELGEELATKMYGEMTEMGMGPTSFSELLENKKTHEVAEQVYDLSNMFRMLSFNICYNPMVEDKVAALEELTAEYLNLVKGATEQTKSAGLLDLIKEKGMSLINGKKKRKKKADGDEDEEEAMPMKKIMGKIKESGEGFLVFKDANQQYRWAAIYTNNYEDRDKPKEIIASYAHKEFVEAVETGKWPYPDLWVWHATKSSRVGQADMIHYDEATGFMFATGTFDSDKEHVAKGLASYPHPLRTSHGMPKELLIYEGGYLHDQIKSLPEPHVIAFYRDREISPLPYGAEANILTSFSILNGGNA